MIIYPVGVVAAECKDARKGKLYQTSAAGESSYNHK
jgi:hypothetical protein